MRRSKCRLTVPADESAAGNQWLPAHAARPLSDRPDTSHPPGSILIDRGTLSRS